MRSAKAKRVAELSKVLLGCFRTGEANDPAVYSGAVIAVLSDYPIDVIERVVDPRTGIPCRCKWLPTIAEIKDECEAIMGPIRRQQERETRVARQLAAPEEDRSQRPTYEELQARCHADGLYIGTVQRPRQSSEDARQLLGASQEQWDAIPDKAMWDKLTLNEREDWWLSKAQGER